MEAQKTKKRVQEQELSPAPSSMADWFRNGGADLWTIFHFGSVGNEEFRDEFVELTNIHRRKLVSSMKREAGRPGFEKATRIFLREWLRRQGRRHSLIDKEDLDWDAKILLCSPFCLNWELDRVASYMGLSGGAVRYRAFRALKARATGIDVKDWHHSQRDCVRHDLFYVDMALGLKWTDGAGVAEEGALLQHRSECARCQRVSSELDRTIRGIRESRLHKMPDDVRAFFEVETPSGSSACL